MGKNLWQIQLNGTMEKTEEQKENLWIFLPISIDQKQQRCDTLQASSPHMKHADSKDMLKFRWSYDAKKHNTYS
jgi:hypothetical protein